MNTSYKGYHFQIISNKDFSKLMKQHESKFYDEIVGLNYSKIISNVEKEALHDLNKKYSNNITLCIKITDIDDSFVGWCYGDQHDQFTFTMHSSFVHPDFRRQGIYSAVLDFVIEWSKQKGFLKVNSNHSTTNNSIIIPKLKKGFVIVGLSLDDRFGMMVNLSYFLNKKLKDLNLFRVNSKMINNKVLDYFD